MKGHVTDEQVASKQYRETDKKGNDQADKAADMGVKAHGADVIRAANLFQIRHQQYVRFMRNVSMHIIEGYLIHRKLIDFNHAPDKTMQVGCSPPTAQTTGQVELVRTMTNINNFSKFCKKHTSAKEVYDFITQTNMQNCNDQKEAVTWLELYIIYRTRGYNKPFSITQMKLDHVLLSLCRSKSSKIL